MEIAPKMFGQTCSMNKKEICLERIVRSIGKAFVNGGISDKKGNNWKENLSK